MTSGSLVTPAAPRNHYHLIEWQPFQALLAIGLAKHAFELKLRKNVVPNLSGLRYDFGVKFAPHFAT